MTDAELATIYSDFLNFYDKKVPSITSGTYLNINGVTTSYAITTSKLSIDVDNTTIKVSEKPGILHRGLYKALGVKWEIK